MPTKFSAFVTICNQRSGSKYASSSFKFGSDIVPLGEIFNPDSEQLFSYWNWLGDKFPNVKHNKTTGIILDHFFEQIYDRFGPFHFDLMYNQMAAITPAWWDKTDFFILDYLKNNEFSVLHLMRDPLDTFISLKTLELTKLPHQKAGEIEVVSLPEEKSSIELNTDEFKEFNLKITSFNEMVATYFSDYINYLKFDFSEIDFNSGFLPEFVLRFCSNALVKHDQRYGSSVQTQPTRFGKSPYTNLKILNFDELAAVNSTISLASENNGNVFKVVSQKNSGNMSAIIKELGLKGGGLCIVLPEVDKGEIFDVCPQNVKVIDLRYGGGMSILGGNHPRKEGIWTQYSHLDTGLARNFVISDSISDDTPIENWKSENHELQQAPYGGELSSEDYRHQHNHYQNFLSEVFNFSSNLNGVAIWGDSGAFVPGAKSWGGFFSARSWPLKWDKYTPKTTVDYRDEDFDAALVGVEIDVLNSGRDWADRSPLLETIMAKIGLQIVGFGKRNTAAVEIRTEDSDDPTKMPETRRGAWKWGIVARNALHEDSTLIHCENGNINRGLDMSLSTFKEGAVLITSAGSKSGITFDHGQAGEIFSEKDGTIVVRGGVNGIRLELLSKEYISISNEGKIEASENLKKSLLDFFTAAK